MMPGSHPYIVEFEAMWVMLRPYRPIAFGTRLARITGHPKDAMLLSQLVYWTRRGRDVEANGGWVHKTREHWLLETGLSREEQENARRRLRNRKLLMEWRGGQPARLHYRLEVEAISDAVRLNCRLVGALPWSIEAIRSDEYAMQEMLGPTVAYRRIFVDLVGNVNAALLLSRMVQLQRREADRQCTWFTLTATEWQRTLGLNRRQLENARARLVRQGLIRELMRHRTGRRVFTQINAVEVKRQLERLVSGGDMRQRLATRKSLLAQCLNAEDERPVTAMPQAVTPGNSADISVPSCAARHPPLTCDDSGAWPNSPTGSPRLDMIPCTAFLPLAGLIHYRWRQTCVPDARVYRGITYRTTTTTGLMHSHSSGNGIKVVVGIDLKGSHLPDAESAGLVWPAVVAQSERELVASHLACIPTADRQLLLDEMAASHRHQPVQLPVAYIASLVRRYLAGEFVPTRAHLERAARERAARMQLAEATAMSERSNGDVESPVSTREAARSHLATIRDALRARSARQMACHV
ncbi:hypothetical protein C9I57_26830 [Trinickia symbiotica]|uniref:Replication protein n=1 Tax=Trinickia symbiotica TaxID=863227 RepID=A0A2T3XM05_9BURK|nr:hypothetical protein [Trinickia symbiotica]PTB17566.1 hypothetical protein C9I57_26830 [Trinickia symbiotica]